MTFFRNKRKDYSIQPPKQLVPAGGFTVTDSSNIDFTYFNGNLTADLSLTTVVAGTYGSSTQIPVLQVDQWGRITGVTLQTIVTSGSGTVTQVNTGTGLTGGPITTTGTVSLNSKLAPADSLTGNSLKYLRVNAGETAVEYATITSTGDSISPFLLMGG